MDCDTNEIADVCRTLVIHTLKNRINPQKKKRKHKYWVKPWVFRRAELGMSAILVEELQEEDRESFINLLRLSPEKYKELLGLVAPRIQRRNTHLRQAIPAKTKLEITLRFLATGNDLSDLEKAFRVPESSISKLLPETLAAVCDVLSDHLKMPASPEEWSEIQEAFGERWNFPGCCRSIDGKHVKITCPPHSGSNFFNYKEYYNVILLAVVDANYCFQYVDYGTNGRANYAGVFRDSTFYRGLINGTLNLLDGHVFIGDDAFPMIGNILKPYSRSGPLDDCKKIFNYRLSRARRTVENAFGLLAARFRVFMTSLKLSLETVDLVVKAAVTLHNWLRKTSPSYYTPRRTFDIEDPDTGELIPGSWRAEVELPELGTRFGSNNYSSSSALLRDAFAEYFMTVGAVPWQEKAALNT